MLVFKGLSLALLQGQSVGPFPRAFQLLSSGFIPDRLDGETLRTTSLMIGVLVAIALVAAKLRERAPSCATAWRRSRTCSSPPRTSCSWR